MAETFLSFQIEQNEIKSIMYYCKNVKCIIRFTLPLHE